MKIVLSKVNHSVHASSVSGLAWNGPEELLTCGEDRNAFQWNSDGEPQRTFASFEYTASDIHCFPSKSSKDELSSDANAPLFTVASSTGHFQLVSKSGKTEKQVSAHTGTITSIKWNHDGTAFATAGEDGVLKVPWNNIWSRNGMLRTQLLTLGHPIHSCAWGPNSDAITVTSGRSLVKKPLLPSEKAIEWVAHAAPILACSWNHVNNLILSGGEDCIYKIWDPYGMLLYTSATLNHPVTSAQWEPSGEYFIVGSLNSLLLCSSKGWPYTKLSSLKTGSLYCLAWAQDGTQFAAGGSNGAVIFGCLIGKKLEWGRITAVIEETNRIRIYDALHEIQEELDFRDRIVKAELGYERLVVCTTSQCCIYHVDYWNTPNIFDIKGRVSLIVLSASAFLTVDDFNGVQIYNMDGRVISNGKKYNLHHQLLSRQSISLSPTVLAAIDRSSPSQVRVFDVATGTQIEKAIQHTTEIKEVALSQVGDAKSTMLAFVDRNGNLYFTMVFRPKLVKMESMAESIRWNDAANVLAVIVDHRLILWYYPQSLCIDQESSAGTRVVADGQPFGAGSQVSSFSGTRCIISREDGSQQHVAIDATPIELHKLVRKNVWEQAERLCRFAKDRTLWSCLSDMALEKDRLQTAEVAMAAAGEVDKMQHIEKINTITKPAAKRAEMLLMRGEINEAESVLLQAGLVYKAIKLNVKCQRWERALELGINFKTHVDTVLLYRKWYLKDLNCEENSSLLQQYADQIELDEPKIMEKIAREKEGKTAKV